MDASFPAKNPSRVIVTTANGIFEDFADVPWGEPDRSPTRDDLIGKFYTLAQDRMPKDQVNNIIAGVQGLRNGKLGPLLDALEATSVTG